MVHRLILAAVALALMWGAFAFGSVYPWAYGPLAASLAVLGILSFVTTRDGRPPLSRLPLALATVGLAAGLQLVPLPDSVLNTISPGTPSFLSQYDLTYLTARSVDPQADTPAPSPPMRPISVAPRATLVGLALFSCLALFALGIARLASQIGARPVAITVLCIGLLLAIVGTVQELALGREPQMLVYGFWQTQKGADPFGPFINRNHFAGWMIMALPVALSLLIESVERAVPITHIERPRDVLTVLSSPVGGQVLMTAVAGVVLALALALTESRSGIAGLLVGCAALMWQLTRHQRGNRGRAIVVGAVVMVVLVALAGAGVETSLGRFLQRDKSDATVSVVSAGGRLGVWRDTLRLFGSSPLTGYGLNSYGTAMVVYQSGDRSLHYQEAHNDYLQLAAEGGLLMGIPILASLYLFVSQVQQRFREAPGIGSTYWLRVGAVAALLSIASQSIFEFSLQMPGNAALFALLVGLALHQSPNLRRR